MQQHSIRAASACKLTRLSVCGSLDCHTTATIIIYLSCTSAVNLLGAMIRYSSVAGKDSTFLTLSICIWTCCPQQLTFVTAILTLICKDQLRRTPPWSSGILELLSSMSLQALNPWTRVADVQNLPLQVRVGFCRPNVLCKLSLRITSQVANLHRQGSAE